MLLLMHLVKNCKITSTKSHRLLVRLLGPPTTSLKFKSFKFQTCDKLFDLFYGCIFLKKPYLKLTDSKILGRPQKLLISKYLRCRSVSDDLFIIPWSGYEFKFLYSVQH